MTKMRSDQHVKIWFAKPGSHPLGHHINVCRLREHRRKFPKDTLHLVSNFRDFTPEHQTYLKRICAELNIQLIDFYSVKAEIEASTVPDKAVQLELFEIARQELSDKNSSLVSASDIVRTLSPVIARGMYSDLDDVKSAHNPLELEAPLGLLAEVGFEYTVTTGVSSVNDINNNPLACDEKRNSFLVGYRKLMLSLYTELKGLKSVYDNMLKNGFLKQPMLDAIKLRVNPVIAENLRTGKKSLFPLIIRDVLGALNQEGKLEDAHYQKIMKYMVINFSGPLCMRTAMENYMSEGHFASDCDRNKLDGWPMPELLSSMSIVMVYESTHQNDTVWRPNEDTTEENFQKFYLEPAARCLQTAWRAYVAKGKQSVDSAPNRAAAFAAPGPMNKE